MLKPNSTLPVNIHPATSYSVYFWFIGYTTILGGLLYGSRWVWELSLDVLKNKSYPPTPVTQYFFVVQVMLMLGLWGIYSQHPSGKGVRRALLLALCGIAWVSAARTAEAFGASGPWGFYSAPGLLATVLGLAMAGRALRKKGDTYIPGLLLSLISLLHFCGSAAAMLLFNILGRGAQANLIASYASNALLLEEALAWMALGVFQVYKSRSV